MNTAIVINLDYPHLNQAAAQRIWEMIEQAFLQAGFSRNNRLFLSPLQPEAASVQVRELMQKLELQLAAQGLSLYGALADFYAVDYLHTENLMLPSPSSIDVQELPGNGSTGNHK